MAVVLLNTNGKLVAKVAEGVKAIYSGDEPLGCDEECPDDCSIDHGCMPTPEEISKTWSKWGSE